jgi:hypothetical protein
MPKAQTLEEPQQAAHRAGPDHCGLDIRNFVDDLAAESAQASDQHYYGQVFNIGAVPQLRGAQPPGFQDQTPKRGDTCPGALDVLPVKRPPEPRVGKLANELIQGW